MSFNFKCSPSHLAVRLVKGKPQAQRGHGAKRSPAATLDQPGLTPGIQLGRPVAGLVAHSMVEHACHHFKVTEVDEAANQVGLEEH